MKLIRTQQGGVLPYVLVTVAIITLLTTAILTYGANQRLSFNDRDYEKKANLLAVSGLEAFLDYYRAFEGETIRDKLNYIEDYNGWGEYHFTTPEGDKVVYKLGKTLLDDDTIIVSSEANVGEGRQKEKSISYIIDLTSDSSPGGGGGEPGGGGPPGPGPGPTPCPEGPYIVTDPEDRVDALPNTIYLQGTVQFPYKYKNTTVETNTELQNLIQKRMDEISANVSSQINQYVSQAVTCNNCTFNQIVQMINSSSSSPVIIKTNTITIDTPATHTFGNPSKPVILILENLNANNDTTLNIHGSMIVLNSLTSHTRLNLNTYSVNGLYGDLWVQGPLTILNEANLNIAATLYANSFTVHSEAAVNAKDMVVNGHMQIYNKSNLSIDQDIFAGSLTVNNTLSIDAWGDLFVENDLTAYNKIAINTGGTVAIGGNATFVNDLNIQTSGGNKNSSLIIDPESGGGC